MSARLAKRQLLAPDHWTTPNGRNWRPEPALTYGPEVADICTAADFAPDAQQELALDLLFAIRPDGSPLTFEMSVVCCRQNLKTGFLKQAALGYLFVTEEPSVVWSAHEMRTTREAASELFELIADTPSLAKFLPATKNRGLYDANGQERQELTTGQTLDYRARRETGMRGLAKRKLLLDEAFALKPSMLGSVLPTMTAQHHPQVVYASSAPRPESDSLREIIARGRGGFSPRQTHLEWLAPFEPCADPDCRHPKDALARGIDCALDREHLLIHANPAVSSGRITLQTLRDLRQAEPPEEYVVEHFGWAAEPAADGGTAIDMKAWGAAGDPTVPAPAKAVVVLDVEPDQSAGTIAVVGQSAGRTLLMVHTAPGMDWMLERLKKVRANLGEGGGVLEVAVHPKSEAATLIPSLDAADIAHRPLTSEESDRGCGTFLAGMKTGRFVHLEQDDLTGPAAVARTRTVNGRQVWDRRDPAVAIGPIAAVGVGAYRLDALTAKPSSPPPAPRSVSIDAPVTGARLGARPITPPAPAGGPRRPGW